jgi:aryl carrier-like protein
MVPAAYVTLPSLPLTPNGKLDRKALPSPDGTAFRIGDYEAPVGEIETTLARLWAEALKVERVGRHDNFFKLGGHSLLVIGLAERMRREGLHADVRALFASPSLAHLAAAIGADSAVVQVPPNRIPPDCGTLTPDMLPLVSLSAADIERIVNAVPGGAANIQDIYALTPLQEGMLFHHLMISEGDLYLAFMIFGFDTRARLDRYLEALQAVIDRHDVLRTAVLWEGLPEPVQVVWRKAPLVIEEILLDPAGGDAVGQLRNLADPRRYRLDIRHAPLMRVCIARDTHDDRWTMLQLSHHIINDHAARDLMLQEVALHIRGEIDRLPRPLPFRNFVTQARRGVSQQEHEAFFRKMLGDVDEPTIPFGIDDVYGDGSNLGQSQYEVGHSLSARIRSCVRECGVSAASLFHLTWALVLSRVSGRDDVVFGTLLFGRMQGGEGADRALGAFINTLPVRIRIGAEGVRQSIQNTHQLLTQLLRHEHASLVLAQRCSAIAAPAPLFGAVLNYVHGAHESVASDDERRAWEGMTVLDGEDNRTNYPLILSVVDSTSDAPAGHIAAAADHSVRQRFVLMVEARSPIDPQPLCRFMEMALEQLVAALENSPATPLHRLDVLPAAERNRMLAVWNATQTDHPGDSCAHQLIEAHAARTPDAIAVSMDAVQQNLQLTYGELNDRANRLAHHLHGAQR